jgi:hypothetical protein
MKRLLLLSIILLNGFTTQESHAAAGPGKGIKRKHEGGEGTPEPKRARADAPMQDAPERKIKVMTKDGQVIEILAGIARRFETIVNILDDIGDPEAAVPLPSVSSHVINYLVAMMPHIPAPAEGVDVNDPASEYVIRARNAVADHIATNPLVGGSLQEILLATNYLDAGRGVIEGVVRAMVQASGQQDYANRDPLAFLNTMGMPELWGYFFRQYHLVFREEYNLTPDDPRIAERDRYSFSIRDLLAEDAIPAIFVGPQDGATLDLEGWHINNLDGLGEIDEIEDVRRLNLNNNQITQLPEGIFAGLDSVEELHLEHNQITQLPEYIFQGLSELQLLDLSNNQIVQLSGKIFDGLQDGVGRLGILNLSNNKITQLEPGVFEELALQYLYLNNNKITQLQPGVFKDAGYSLEHTYGVWIDLSGNLISDIDPAVFAGIQLVEIDLKGNRLSGQQIWEILNAVREAGATRLAVPEEPRNLLAEAAARAAAAAKASRAAQIKRKREDSSEDEGSDEGDDEPGAKRPRRDDNGDDRGGVSGDAPMGN